MKLIIVALGVIFLVAKYLEENLKDSTRQNIKEYLKGWHERASSPDTVKLVQNNFLLLSFILDKAYGTKLVSYRLVSSTTFLTWGFIMFTILCSYINPYSPFCFTPTPAEVVAFSADLGPKLREAYDKNPESFQKPPITPRVRDIYLASLKAVQRLNTPLIRVEFTLACLLIFWMFATFLGVFSTCFARLLLRDLAKTEGIMIMITSLCFNLIMITTLLFLWLACNRFNSYSVHRSTDIRNICVSFFLV